MKARTEADSEVPERINRIPSDVADMIMERVWTYREKQWKR